MRKVQSGWRDYLNMDRRKRNRLEKRAKEGKEDALEEFNRMSRSIRRTANERLRELEKAGLDYGPAYNNFAYYLQSEFDGRTRVPTPRQMGYDISEIRWLNDYAVKFLKSPNSTVKGMIESNTHRVERLMDYEILSREFVNEDKSVRDATWRDYSEFLRFLGSEEVATAIDEYGESDVVVDIMWDYWNNFDSKTRGDNLKLVKMALADYLDGNVDFATAMRRVGVKIENYRSRK